MKLKWLLLQVLLLVSSFHLHYAQLLIDCGATQPTSYNDSLHSPFGWIPDENFTSAGAGKSFFLSSATNVSFPMNTLRSFPSGATNCYHLSLYPSKFLIRAGFFYGNYDSLSRPPRFDLTIDGHKWATVDMSQEKEDEPVYYEMVYRIKKDHKTRVCLERRDKDHVPFISSLEAVLMYDQFYELMQKDEALLLHSRTNYGANKSIQEHIGFHEECCGRVWESKEMAEYQSIQSQHLSRLEVFQENDNLPPWPVMGTAIQAQTEKDSIDLPLNFSISNSHNNNVTTSAYFVLYFKDPVLRRPMNRTSTVNIYINGVKFRSTIDVPNNYPRVAPNISVVSIYPVRVNGTAIVTISPANGTILPPLLNAMEVFSAIDVSKATRILLCNQFVTKCFALFHFIGVIIAYFYV